MPVFKTTNFKQTKDLAKLLAQAVLKGKKINSENALVLALSGHLGGGKTTFVQGFMAGAGIKKKITSPTFTIIKNYPITKLLNYKKIYHIDCYRLKKAKELLDLGLEEILINPKNIVLIEWPKIAKKYLPKDAIRIKFKHGKKENERTIDLLHNNFRGEIFRF